MKALFALLVLASFSASADCFTQARMVMSSLEADNLCVNARPGFDKCYLIATMAMNAREAVEFCAQAERGIADCQQYVSVAVGYGSALQLCQKAPRDFMACVERAPFGMRRQEIAASCVR